MTTQGYGQGTYLCRNKPVREHVGLFGQFTTLKDFRRCPPVTICADICPTELRSILVCECGKTNVRKASAARRVHEDVLLDKPQYKHRTRRVVWRMTDLLQVSVYNLV